MGKVGNRNIPFLIDTGCFQSLIPKDVVTDFKKEFYEPLRFAHDTSLQAHNNSNVPIQEEGVILPVRLTDINSQTRVLHLHFLVETAQHHQPIIGYRDIKNIIGTYPTQNITFEDWTLT